MSLIDKYQSLIDMAKQHGVDGLTVQDNGAVLNVSGVAPSESVKQAIWDEYGRLDPDMRAGDMVLNIEVSAEETYEVKGGDSLSKIASHYEGVSWQDIFEANKDQIKDPNMIHPGQKLRIPKK